MGGSIQSMNTNPIIKRIVVKAEAALDSPALVGSGESESTDMDVLVDSSGVPFLPGTSLAGVLKTLLEPEGETFLAEMFGDSPFGPGGGAKAEEKGQTETGGYGAMSALWVLDAAFANAEGERPTVVELDGVALDPENKVALDKRKYDFEAVETDSVFTLRMMLVIREGNDAEKLQEGLGKIVFSLLNGNVAVGAKTNRGFGRVRCGEVFEQAFDFKDHGVGDLARWTDFSWGKDDGWEDAKSVEYASREHKLTAELKLIGSVMIRDIENIDGDEDYKHISSNGKPVIFGTSWAGAIRSGLYRLLKPVYEDQTASELDKYFGMVEENTSETIPSLIAFDASFLEEDNELVDGYRTITRVKIDRFTGGAADGALFTERPWYGGRTTLAARWKAGGNDDKEIRKILLLALEAIDKGLLTIGGETAVGRGVFKVVNAEIDGQSVWTQAKGGGIK